MKADYIFGVTFNSASAFPRLCFRDSITNDTTRTEAKLVLFLKVVSVAFEPHRLFRRPVMVRFCFRCGSPAAPSRPIS